MIIYRYRAVDKNGRIVQGRMESVNEADLESRLAGMQLELISFSEVTVNRKLSFGQKITTRDLIIFCFHMEQLISAGVPVLEGLDDLRNSMDNPRFREILSALIVSIEGGLSLSEALARFPAVFDEIFVSLIRAGETSGDLSTVLKDMTESLKWQDELAEKTKKLMMYPMFVGGIVSAVILFLMIYLVPQLIGFVASMGEELPAHTKMLIMASDFIIEFWYLLFLLPLLFVASRYLAKSSSRFRYVLDSFKLNLWLIGPVIRKIILSRFTRYFALLYSSGISVLASIRICEGIVGNKVIAASLSDIEKNISNGKSLSEGIEISGLFPPLVLRMVKVGESTGEIDRALVNVSYFYDRDVNDSIERLQAMIGPLITIILAMVLGWVMISVLGPIYDIISNLSL